MKYYLSIIILLLMTGCLPAQEPKQLIVTGIGEIEKIPDSFRMSASVRIRHEDREEALRALSAAADELTEKMPRLEGLEAMKVEASDLEFCLRLESDAARKIMPIHGVKS